MCSWIGNRQAEGDHARKGKYRTMLEIRDSKLLVHRYYNKCLRWLPQKWDNLIFFYLQFEQGIELNKFLEYGEYDGNYYGTKFDSIRQTIKSGKISILDLNPQVNYVYYFMIHNTG